MSHALRKPTGLRSVLLRAAEWHIAQRTSASGLACQTQSSATLDLPVLQIPSEQVLT